MVDRTTVQVRKDTKDRLEAMKQESESMDDVIRRELGLDPQKKSEMVNELVRYLSEENRSSVKNIVDLLCEEFNLDLAYDDVGGSGGNSVLELNHPETGLEVVTVETAQHDDDFRVEYRGTDGMNAFAGWGTVHKIKGKDLDGEDRQELLRLARGAYSTASD